MLHEAYISRAAVPGQADVQGEVHRSDQSDAGPSKGRTGGNTSAARRDRVSGSSPVLSGDLGRYKTAYYGLIHLHANLLLATMSRDDIEDLLSVEYPFNTSQDCVDDLRAALNAEVANRNRMSRIQNKQENK